MSRATAVHVLAGDHVDTPGKRGRKATPPSPDEGPLAAFAHDLWALKCRAGDPSFATMCTRMGAAASKSSLAAATRGTTLPSWDTTWEFVRVLAVGELGADAQDTRREWLARWTAAAAAGTTPAEVTADPPVVVAVPDRPASEPARRARLRWPGRGTVVVTGVLVVLAAAVLGTLATASPAAVPARTSAISAQTGEGDNASFEGDVTFPDGSVVAPGQRFTKVWQLRNTGSLRWEGRYLARVNTTACQAPDMVPIPVTDPGRPVRIPVPVTAAESPARCKIYWKMTDADRRMLLPDKNPVFLDVVVRDQQ